MDNNIDPRSYNAALRLGFCYEGVYKNDMVVKGRSRDTAWFSITDDEFPELDPVYEAWMGLGSIL
jgi:RimJ/RimL family protein N-acetyltransferase